MHSKFFSIAALGSSAYAQSVGLAAALAGNNQTSQLASLLGTLPSITQSLSSLSNITLLAPSNAALSTLLTSSAGAALTSNPGLLEAILQYHVLNGTYLASAITNSLAFIPSALTDTRYANVTGGQRVEALRASNSVSFFSGLLQKSSVIEANINYTGGVIHVIDRLLTLPQNVSTTLAAAELTGLYGALNATNLLSTVDGLQDVTIFAPNNTAFQLISSALANATVADLQSILTYHLVNGSTPLYSTDLANNTSYQTLNGVNLTIHAGANGALFVNGARVITPNVLIAGGVVHVIDNVLNPNSTSSTSSTDGTGSPAFSSSTSSEAASTTSSSSSGAMPIFSASFGMAALFSAGAVLANM